MTNQPKPGALRREPVTGIRLSPYGRCLLNDLASTMGGSHRSVVEEALRLLQRSMGEA